MRGSPSLPATSISPFWSFTLNSDILRVRSAGTQAPWLVYAGADTDPVCSCRLHILVFKFQYLPLVYIFRETSDWRRELTKVEQDRALSLGGLVPLACPQGCKHSSRKHSQELVSNGLLEL